MTPYGNKPPSMMSGSMAALGSLKKIRTSTSPWKNCGTGWLKRRENATHSYGLWLRLVGILSCRPQPKSCREYITSGRRGRCDSLHRPCPPPEIVDGITDLGDSLEEQG